MQLNANTKIEICVDFFFCDQRAMSRVPSPVSTRGGMEPVKEESTPLISEPSAGLSARQTRLPKWMKVTAIAATSALAGGLAAAWFYRKTVSRLQNAVETTENSNFGMPGGGADED
jgi:hypothetical protein